MLELEEPLGDAAGALVEQLQEMGGEVQSIAGHKTIVCEWHFEKEPYIPKAPWEDLVVVLPGAETKTLIYATSPAALEGYFAREAEELLVEVKKKHKLVARPEVAAWVACLNDKQQEVDAQEPQVQFLMVWSEDEKMPTFDMQFFPAAKDYQELTRRHPLLDTIVGPFPSEEGESPPADHELKSVEGGSHLELKLPVLDETRSPSDLTKEEERLERCKMAISIFVGNLLLDRNR